jgi:hypothetical protein
MMTDEQLRDIRAKIKVMPTETVVRALSSTIIKFLEGALGEDDEGAATAITTLTVALASLAAGFGTEKKVLHEGIDHFYDFMLEEIARAKKD